MSPELKNVVDQIEVLLKQAMKIANTNSEDFTILEKTFYSGSQIEKMCDPDDEDNYTYLDDYYAQNYPNGTWLSSSDFC